MAGVSFVRGAARDEDIAADFTSLFRDIPLVPAVEERARAIVAQCVADRNALPSQMTERLPSPAGADGTMLPGQWARLALLHGARDAALRALLTDDDQRRLFDRNAAVWHAQINAVRLPEAT